MIISPEIRKIADDFFANTVENNEVMIVKWTFPDGQLPDLTLERAQRDYELADETEAKVEALLAAGGLTHEDETPLHERLAPPTGARHGAAHERRG